MYPRVRQFESSELHRYLARKDFERGRERSPRRRGRWLVLAILAAAVAGAVYAAAANAAPASSATASVAFGGKTYRFAGGTCTTSPGFTVNIGTFAAGSTAKARPYFGFFLTSARSGTYSGKQAAVSFASGATHVSLTPTAASRVTLDRGLRSGSFAGKDLLGRKLTGSFHC